MTINPFALLTKTADRPDMIELAPRPGDQAIRRPQRLLRGCADAVAARARSGDAGPVRHLRHMTVHPELKTFIERAIVRALLEQ